MNEAITIFDPNAPVLEAVGYETNWIALAISGAALMAVAVVLHRVLRRRLRANAVELASGALVRTMRLDRASRRGLSILVRHSEKQVSAGILLLNSSMIVQAATRYRKANPSRRSRQDVNALLKRLSITPEPVVGRSIKRKRSQQAA